MVAGVSDLRAGVERRVARRPSGSDDIDVVVRLHNREAVVTVSGRVTIDSSPYLRSPLLQLLQSCVPAAVLIDMTAVVYLDSSGIITLLEALTLARDLAVKLRLQGLSGQPRMLAEITELATIFASANCRVVFS